MSTKVAVEFREELRTGRFTCHYCPEPADNWDHVVPRCLGGSDHRVNLQPSCVACNHAKADALPTCRCEQCALALLQWQRGLGRRKRQLLIAQLTDKAVAAAARLAAVEAALSGVAAP